MRVDSPGGEPGCAGAFGLPQAPAGELEGSPWQACMHATLDDFRSTPFVHGGGGDGPGPECVSRRVSVLELDASGPKSRLGIISPAMAGSLVPRRNLGVCRSGELCKLADLPITSTCDRALKGLRASPSQSSCRRRRTLPVAQPPTRSPKLQASITFCGWARGTPHSYVPGVWLKKTARERAACKDARAGSGGGTLWAASPTPVHTAGTNQFR